MEQQIAVALTLIGLSIFGAKPVIAEAPLAAEKLEFIEIKSEVKKKVVKAPVRVLSKSTATSTMYYIDKEAKALYYPRLVYWADYYGASARTIELVIEGYRPAGIHGESSWDIDAAGDLRSGVYMANGLGQFWKTTFVGMAKQMGEPTLKYDSPEDQLRVMAWAFAHGEGHQWTVYRKLKAAGVV